jgi:hypothetical protein
VAQVGNIQSTFSQHSGNIQSTFREHHKGDKPLPQADARAVLFVLQETPFAGLASAAPNVAQVGNTLLTFREHSVNIQGTFREHHKGGEPLPQADAGAGLFDRQKTPFEGLASAAPNVAQVRNIQGTFREHSVNIQSTFSHHSGNIIKEISLSLKQMPEPNFSFDKKRLLRDLQAQLPKWHRYRPIRGSGFRV